MALRPDNIPRNYKTSMSDYAPTETLSLDQALAILNEAVDADPEAMAALISARVRCNKTLADHPSIQVLAHNPDEEITPGSPNVGSITEVGFLGVLNGLFGIRADGWGHITAEFDDTGKLIRFARTPEKCERRKA